MDADTPAAQSPRPPVVEEPDRDERPGVVPGAGHRPATATEPEEGEERRPFSELIVEVAPPVGEQQPDPDRIIEVAPDDPAERPPGPDPYEPGPIPEVRPPDPDPSRPPDPSEVIT